jgi:predicted RNA binding protein YcfA (HicA-like mRNA interferase family)
MPPLPVVSGQELVRVLEKLGWSLARRKGSHMILTRPGAIVTLSIPDHRELDRGTLRSLIRAAGLSAEQLLSALGRS